ncbi:HET-domain-containing protein [Pyrenochaeta sp. DS3sAY3a]|nr:HET-domain-containing protein [Pyrenochaeta sp. DS3sAY3a]
MNICSTCLELSQGMYTENYRTEVRVEDRPNLRDSKDSCDLCRLLYKNIKKDSFDQRMLRHIRPPLFYNGWKSILSTEKNRFCGSGFESPHHYAIDSAFSIWADKDSLASAKIVTQPPIFYENEQSIAPILTYLLNDCKSSHGNCKKVIDGHGCAQLPTRVLHVSSISGVLSVKLVERGGLGDYCALSHCWGSPEKRPLTTTRANLTERIEGIPFYTLPKTFQNAIMLVHSIGISYIWIDSLCIIQDDEADWSSEAKHMAQIYSNATIVIAAAYSRDSTQGLFFTERPDPVVAKAPFISDGKIVDYFYVSILPRGVIEPVVGPLRTRAWAFQEWYLSTRLVTFMPGGLLWKCKTIQVNERGSREHAETYEDLSWLDLMEQYTGKHLSFESDRLYALHGIVAKEHSDRRGRFLFEYGVWEEHLLEEILWIRNVSDLEENGLKLPSWSWASLTGERHWPLKLTQGLKESVLWYTKSQDLKIDSGALIVPGHFVRSTLKFCPLFVEDYCNFENRSKCSTSRFVGWGNGWRAIYRGDDETYHLGIALFDIDCPPSAQCLVLASTVKNTDSTSEQRSTLSQPDTSSYEAVGRKEQNPSSGPERKRILVPATMHTVDKSNVVLGGSIKRKRKYEDFLEGNAQGHITTHNYNFNLAEENAESEFDDPRRASQPMKEESASRITVLMFWGLLVTPTGNGNYKRIGMALIYPDVLDQLDVAYGEVRIR